MVNVYVRQNQGAQGIQTFWELIRAVFSGVCLRLLNVRRRSGFASSARSVNSRERAMGRPFSSVARFATDESNLALESEVIQSRLSKP
jgi:hypothetical protein